MLKFSKCIFVLIALSVLLGACRTKIDWESPELDPSPTVNSFVVAGKPIKVFVSLTGEFNDTPVAICENATVELYADDAFVETLEYSQEGFYLSELIVEPKVEYRCVVNIPDYETVTCSTTLPSPMQIIGIEHISQAVVDEEGTTQPALILSFTNISTRLRYYEVVINLYKKSHSSDDFYVIHPWIIQVVDPVLLNEGLPILVFSNEMIEDDSYTMAINYATSGASYSPSTGWVGNVYPFTVELRSVCYDYYKYAKQFYLYVNANDEPLIGQGTIVPFHMHSNVDNGYGIFAGYSSVVSDTIYPQDFSLY